jgi:tyrosyl-tRNA synthetase
MGGSDQWGNIVNGVDLARRAEGAEVYGLTCPLLTTASGAKMGKTAQGAVWLNADALSPYDFWQYWRNTADADVGRFLGYFTELPMEEVRRLGALAGAEINEAKRVLAGEVTALVHGREAAEAAERTAQGAFSKQVVTGTGTITVSGPRVSAQGHVEVSGMRVVDLGPSDFEGGGLPVFQLFVRSGLAASGKEAKRLIKEGGARIDDQPVTDPAARLPAERFAEPVKLSAGRKRHALARLG